MKTKAVIVYSGGMDSRTVLEKALVHGRECFPITMFYGQRHNKEIDCAMKVCEEKQLVHKIIQLDFMHSIARKNALTGSLNVPEGHYEAESMKDTVVPNRNMILLSIAISYAIDIGVDEVWYGAHSGDHHIYPDCRPEFVDAMKFAATTCHDTPISIVAPFLDGNKETILTYGLKHNVDYKDTWTCYNGREKACGKCGSCQERLEAFNHLNIEDPLQYEE
jgi:7-cyano-7-deazaguanine synthase